MASAAERPTRRLWLTLALALCLSVTLVSGAARPILLPLPEGYDPRLHTSARVVLADDDINISCGARSHLGRFLPDQYGWMLPGTFDNTMRDEFTNDKVPFTGADPVNVDMLKTNRYGLKNYTAKWGYNVPVRNPGLFNCSVHFAELSDVVEKPNVKRVFNLNIEAAQNSQTFNNLNVYNTTGKFSSFVRTAELLVVTRYLKFTVQKAAGSDEGAIMSGVTCVRAGPLPAGVKPAPAPVDGEEPIRTWPIGSINPAGPTVNSTELNINCGGAAIGPFLADNNAWHHHYGPSTVFSVAKTQPIGMGKADASKEQALRDSVYGYENNNFGYQIALTQSGMWECHLHFAEIDSTKKIGDRVFDIQVQHLRLNNFDIKKKSGGAPFTAVVQTFPLVPVSDYLLVRMWAQKGKGDPSINAIMCTLKQPKSKEDMQKMLASYETIPTTPRPSQAVSPPPTLPLPTSEPPALSPLENITNEATPVPVPTADTQEPAFDPKLVSEFTPDAALTPAEGEEISELNLGLVVRAGTDMNKKLKDTLRNIIAIYSKANESKVAFNSIEQIAEANWFTARVATTEVNTSFAINCTFATAESTALQARSDIVTAITSGRGTKDLEMAGYAGAELGLLSAPAELQPAGAPATSGTATSTIVAAVVGSCLVALLLVAVVVFFVVQRHRRNEVNPAAFDAPPPEMEDSDGSAPSSSEHSESRNSADYLDDDSTFTAATSHQADPEAGVTLDKDVWGRGSS